MKKVGLFVLSLFLFYSLSSCKGLEIQNCLPIFAMDTTINVTFYNVEDYETHYKKIKEIYQKYDNISTDFKSGSNENSVYDLNMKRSISASEELIELVSEAVRLFEDTGGYYNPYIGRLSHLWKRALETEEIPSEELILQELSIINETKVNIADKMITLTGNGNLDLGGIAKGYATHKAKEYLDEMRVSSYLINAGSSNVILGDKHNQDFTIALEEPYRNQNIVLLKDKNIAIGSSSGKYQNRVIEGIRYHHLLNPFTGYPSNLYDNVNVLCENSILCDVYATAIFSMEEELAKSFAETKHIELLLFKDEKIIYQSSGWKVYA